MQPHPEQPMQPRAHLPRRRPQRTPCDLLLQLVSEESEGVGELKAGRPAGLGDGDGADTDFKRTSPLTDASSSSAADAAASRSSFSLKASGWCFWQGSEQLP